MEPLKRHLIDLNAKLEKLSGELTQHEKLTGDVRADLAALKGFLANPPDLMVTALPSSGEETLYLYFNPAPIAAKTYRAAVSALKKGSMSGMLQSGQPTTYLECAAALAQGDILVLQQGSALAFTLPSAGGRIKQYKVENERVVRGPDTGFGPDLFENIAHMRALAKQPSLRVRQVPVNAQFRVFLVYLLDVAQESTLAELERRITAFSGSPLLDTTQLETVLADNPYSPFQNVLPTRRVDRTLFAIYEGRVALFTDGSPDALLVPSMFVDQLSTPEDRYLPSFMATANRTLRYGSAVATIMGEALYIALATIHQELLPTPLAFAIARSRIGVPLPVFLEVFLMAVLVDILREATIRLPQMVSQTIAIVGALVIGQAVVRASLISAPVVVIVAGVTLVSFAVPNYELANTLRWLRYPGMIFAATFGLFGVVWYTVLLFAHMAKLRSFGQPFLAPIAPMRRTLKRSILDMPKHPLSIALRLRRNPG